MTDSGRILSRRQVLIAIGGTAVAAGSAGFYLAVRSYRQNTGTSYDAPSATLGELAGSAVYDVCIVGSGPAGTILGIELASRGLRTVLLESGVNWTSMFEDPRYGRLDSYEVDGDADYPLRASRLRALGGTSNLWTGRCNRLHAIDFEPNAFTPPGGGWPIRLADLLRYYAKAEQTLRVNFAGPGEYPAVREIPRWRAAIDPPLRGLKEFRGYLEGEGLAVDPSPTSSGIGHGGPVRIAGDYLPQYAELPGALVVTGATVTGLSKAQDGRIGAAEARDLEGRAKSVSARVFVIACGAVETARLLLLSRTQRDPGGIGNRFDQVGRYFHEHPNLSLGAELPAGTGVSVEAAGRSDQFYDALKKEGHGSVLLAYRNNADKAGRVKLRIGATLEMFPAATNRIMLSAGETDLFGNPGAHVRLSYSPQDRQTLERARALLQSIYDRLGAGDITEQPVHWSHHHCGGVQMGKDARHSVVDGNLRVHDTPNLFLASSGCFVTSGAAHPTLLIVALAHRLADHLSDSFSSGRFRQAAGRQARRARFS